MITSSIRAVLWDFGGVFTTSPFTAFTLYEKTNGLPKDFIRSVNAHNSNTNAWAMMERNEVTHEEFCYLFEAETRAAGHAINGGDLLPLLSGEIQLEMVAALKIVAKSHKTACLTNNMQTGHGPAMSQNPSKAKHISQIMEIFGWIIESSQIGVRKPERKFYELACEKLEIQPNEAVFLDDLGVNLKPARAMGMTTIKVVGPDQAIADLEAVLGISLRA